MENIKFILNGCDISFIAIAPKEYNYLRTN